jgi:hypothetical protein
VSAYREEKPLTEDDRFTFEDSQILKELRESDRLTEREKLAVQRLYRTYQYGGLMAAEKNFENKVKAFLKDTGAWLLKYWGGAAYTKSGIPDLLVCSDGCFLGVEVKAPNGEPSLLQLVNLKKIRESGGYGILLYPKDFEQFKMFIAKKSELNAWYLSNIEDQKRWEIKLSK